VNNCDPAVIDEALDRSGRSDRLELLREAYRLIAGDAVTEEGRIVAAVTFAQKHFFHHFAGQPMVNGISVLDPVASLLIAYGRCGTSARFLVDLFETNGTPARLAAGACHTWAEVLCEGRWVLADASLFPPGVLPRDREGRLLSLRDAIVDPSLLDRVPSYVNYHYEYVEAFFAEYPETVEELRRWLVGPLLPSSGYFAEEFYTGSARPAGTVETFTKTGWPDGWARDPNFGWGGVQVEARQVRGYSIIQRPSQPRNLRRQGTSLRWDASESAGTASRVIYRVVCSPISRGWEYDALPVGCTFDLPGVVFEAEEPRIDLDQVAAFGRFVSVVATDPRLDAATFYLPSRELALEGLGVPGS
jgi:hypothetical protein